MNLSLLFVCTYFFPFRVLFRKFCNVEERPFICNSEIAEQSHSCEKHLHLGSRRSREDNVEC